VTLRPTSMMVDQHRLVDAARALAEAFATAVLQEGPPSADRRAERAPGGPLWRRSESALQRTRGAADRLRY